MPFDEAQLRAVRHGDGPMLVLAGPGSGKTTVIVGRLLCLIGERGIEPERILVITFTRAAAKEMQKRFEKERDARQKESLCMNLKEARDPRKKGSADGADSTFPPAASSPVFGTFHSVFFSILRNHCGFSAKSLIQTKDQYAILKKILKDDALPLIYTDDIAELLLADISRAKNAGADPLLQSAQEAFQPKVCAAPLFWTVYARYSQFLRNMRLLDFDDMLLRCRELFLLEPKVLAEEQARFRYLLVDEFQDINALQYEILAMLARPHENLFIVGDDDQSIYGFRGSRPEIMLGFPKAYPEAKSVLLSRNYRSGEKIVERAGGLIAKNRMRFKKDIRAGRELFSTVRTETCEDEKEELARLLLWIRHYQKNGLSLSEMAVLFRTNAAAAGLKEGLGKAGIACTETGKAQSGEAAQDVLQLATFHGAKGLEFTAVFIAAANEGITPHRKSAEGEALEEERRMFYVAMTRAKQYLHIFNTKYRYNRPQKISRFAEEAMEADKSVNGRVKGFGGRR